MDAGLEKAFDESKRSAILRPVTVVTRYVSVAAIGFFFIFPYRRFYFMPTPLDMFPPFMCRAVARNPHRTRAMTVQELAEASGLNPRTIKRLSNKDTWDGISVSVAYTFAKACGVDLLRLDKAKCRKMTWTNRLSTKRAIVEQWLIKRSGDNG